MKTKKILVRFFIVCMVVMSFTTTAFANIVDDLKKEPNAMALVTIDNEDCTEIANLKDLSVRITAPGTNINIIIPVEEVKEDGETLGLWLGYPKDRISDAIMKELAEVQGNIDLGTYEKDPEKFLTDIDNVLSKFHVEIIGLPENHYSVVSSSIILTNDIFQQIVDMFKELIKEEVGDFDSFASLIDVLLQEAGLTMDQFLAELEPEDAEAVKNLIENLDPLLAYITSSDFTGLLIAGAELACECPSIDYFQIIHKYYQRTDGRLKLMATVYEGSYDDYFEGKCLQGYTGDIIKAKDFVNCKYDGQLFDYMGSYDSYVLYDNYKWSDYELDSFTLGDWQTDGLILRYVIDKEKEAVTEKPVSTQTPDTGDRASLGMYIVLLFTALGASGAIAGHRRKK